MGQSRPKPRLRAEIADGKVIPLGGLEIIVSDHCNIACRQCNHGSPVMRKWNADPEETAETIATLARVFRPSFIKFIGGEPLLNPRLAELIRRVRATGISDHYMLVTNGMLLDRMDPAIWSLIDELELSHYPGAQLTDAVIETHRRSAAEAGVKFTHNLFEDFRRTFARAPIRDEDLVRRIFSACKIARVWGCHGVYRGRLFRCPQSMYAPALSGQNVEEGLAISDRPGLRDEILAFLNSDEPLASCRNCLGTSGVKEPHALLGRKEWELDLDRPLEDCIDQALLAENQVLMKFLDDCKTHESHVETRTWRRFVERLGYVPSRFRRSTFRRPQS